MRSPPTTIFLKLRVALVAACMLGCGQPDAPAANVIFIVLDDRARAAPQGMPNMHAGRTSTA